VKKCLRKSCANFREDNEVSENNADTDWRNPGNVFTADVAAVTSMFSEVALCCSTQEGRCRACLGDCIVSYHFPREFPDIFFFPLLQGYVTTERTLQDTYRLGPHLYKLYAYSLFHSATSKNRYKDSEESDGASEKSKMDFYQAKGISHYTLVFYANGARIVYNDIKGCLSSRQNQKLSTAPVVSIWLIRDDKM